MNKSNLLNKEHESLHKVYTYSESDLYKIIFYNNDRYFDLLLVHLQYFIKIEDKVLKLVQLWYTYIISIKNLSSIIYYA